MYEHESALAHKEFKSEQKSLKHGVMVLVGMKYTEAFKINEKVLREVCRNPPSDS